jgi:hypothetical protein
MKDERSIHAVNVAEQYGLGNATDAELRDSAVAAYAAAYASASNASYAAASAADSAAANAASYVAFYAADSAAAYASARKQNQLLTANICRELFTEELIRLIDLKLQDSL